MEATLEKKAEACATLLGWHEAGTAENTDIKKAFIYGYGAAMHKIKTLVEGAMELGWNVANEGEFFKDIDIAVNEYLKDKV